MESDNIKNEFEEIKEPNTTPEGEGSQAEDIVIEDSSDKEVKKSPEEVTFEDVLRAAEKKAKEEEEAREAQAKAEDEARLRAEEENKKTPDLKAAEEKIALYQDKYLRTLAEFDNYRNRTIKEKAQMYDDGASATIEKLLPVVDNLERALNAATNEEDPLLKGVQMTFNQLTETLKTMGVEEIPALGEKFDPVLHSAVAHEENPDVGENEITLVLQKGYRYKERVIRPSMVKVAN